MTQPTPAEEEVSAEQAAVSRLIAPAAPSLAERANTPEQELSAGQRAMPTRAAAQGGPGGSAGSGARARSRVARATQMQMAS